MVKKSNQKPFVRISLLIRASAPPLYAALLLAAAHFTARLLADAPSRRQNSYGLVWHRHGAYGGRLALFIRRCMPLIGWWGIVCRTSVELCASASLCSFFRKSYVLFHCNSNDPPCLYFRNKSLLITKKEVSILSNLPSFARCRAIP